MEQNRYFYILHGGKNCQRFLIDLLQSNNLLAEPVQKFILQDMTEIVKKLPWYTKLIGQQTTDLAHRFDIALHGQGLNPIPFNRKDL